MALDFIDSTAHSGTGASAALISRKWTTVLNANYTTTFSRVAGYSIAVVSSIAKTLSYVNERFLGAAYYLPTSGGSAPNFMGFASGGINVAYLRIETDFTVSIISGGNNTRIWNSGSVHLSITGDTFHYYEFHVVMGGSTPVTVTCDLKIDGQIWVTSVSGNTGYNASSLLSNAATMNQIFFGGSGSGANQGFVCDVYCCNVNTTDINGHATTLNTFLGDISVEVIIPISDNTIQWTIGAGGGSTHFNLVKEIPPDDDTTYVESSTTSQIDTYNFQNIVGFSGTLLGCQLLLYAKKDAEGSRAIRALMGGIAQVNNNGTDQYLYDYYDYFIFPLDSDNGTAWTPAVFNAENFGIKLNI